MALTGTPLINDIEDFRAIWQFLGWIDDKKPLADLMHHLEETGMTPAEPAFYAAARKAVIEMGIVRRRKIDVAADIPARRVADLPVELDDAAGRSIREAERELARRLVSRYLKALETRTSGPIVTGPDGIDHELVRRVATWERDDTTTTKSEDNVFTLMRRLGQAKAGLAADYAAQLARNVGKVVFFAKHIDVMDIAEKTFAERGILYSTIRGNQTATAREESIDGVPERPGRRTSSSARSPRRASASTSRSPPTSCSPSSPGPTRSRPRPSTGCTGSGRPSRSPRGGSSPRRRSTPRSPSSSTARPASPPAPSTGPTRRSRPRSTSSSRLWSRCSRRR